MSLKRETKKYHHLKSNILKFKMACEQRKFHSKNLVFNKNNNNLNDVYYK